MKGQITITMMQALGLREAIRPLSCPSNSPIDPAALVLLHEKILMALVEFETSTEQTAVIVLSQGDCIFISQFLSMQDGEWAQDILKQARRALFEIRTGILPSWSEDNARIHEMLLRVEDEDAESGTAGAK